MQKISVWRFYGRALAAGFILMAFAGGVSAETTSIPVPLQKPVQALLSFFPKVESRESLSEADIKQYKTIFDVQSRGEFSNAQNKITKLQNGLLLGHVLAQQYLHDTSARTSFSDLKNWLDQYGDHPQADKIYKLATARGNAADLKTPLDRGILSGRNDFVYESGRKYQPHHMRTDEDQKKAENLQVRVRKLVQENDAEKAHDLLKKDKAIKILDDVEIDQLKSTIAAGYLYGGYMKQAADISHGALKRSGEYVPMAGWINGMANWQAGEFGDAAKAFEVAAESEYASAWMVSGAAFWASRAYMRVGEMKKVSRWLKIATDHPRTFYGLIAIRALGQAPEFHWSLPDTSSAAERKIIKTKRGSRARALIKIGQISLAEMELESLAVEKGKKWHRDVLSYALAHKLPALSMQMGHLLSPAKGKGDLYDTALYPLVPWEPMGGYKIDRTLLHAFMRQESRFRAMAESASGASGLMQLMPATADSLKQSDKYNVMEPSYNMQLGQKYIQKLLNDKSVDQDIMSLAVAYNAGPSKLAKWKGERAHMKDDVLLFIETIPFNETRAFVERVLANYWIYQMRLGQPTPTLDAVAEGKWARYEGVDNVKP